MFLDTGLIPKNYIDLRPNNSVGILTGKGSQIKRKLKFDDLEWEL